MQIEDFVEKYPVELKNGGEVPLSKKIEWKIKGLLKSDSAEGSVLPYPCVSVSYWRPEDRSFVNFGDELAHVMASLALAQRGMTLSDEVNEARLLVTIGSSLHRARTGTTVWGTGLHGASLTRDHVYERLDVRAVRGPLTAKFLRKRGISVPAVYGDPGLLLPQLTAGRFVATNERPVAVVPNLHEMLHFTSPSFRTRFPNVDVIDPRRAWNTVVKEILKYKFILASSLHGLVVADAYGIPSRYIRLTEKENILKYHDYYLGTGRVMQYADSVEEALEMGGGAQMEWRYEPLLNAFPYDLWE